LVTKHSFAAGRPNVGRKNKTALSLGAVLKDLMLVKKKTHRKKFRQKNLGKLPSKR